MEGHFNDSDVPTSPGIGVDMEEIANMPVVSDFREDEFYKMNFTPAEMAYCILQPNPYASFAGFFAAKEAIVKADNRFKTIPFNEIFIDHVPGGQPVFAGFNISISHVSQLSIAIAIKNPGQQMAGFSLQSTANGNSSRAVFLAVIAIVLALIAICILLFK